MANNEDNGYGTGNNSQTDLLSEIQKIRAEKDELLKQIEWKIDVLTEKLTEEHEQKFDEISDKLRTIENLVSKNSKIDEDVETKESLNQAAGALKNLSIRIDSVVPKQSVLVSEKRFGLKHVFKNVETFVEERHYHSASENHFNVNSCIFIKRSNGHLACYLEICNPKNKTGWSVKAKGDLKINGRNETSKCETFTHRYEKNAGYGYSKFLKWDEMKNEYLIDGCLTVEAHVEIIETSGIGKEKIRTFDESQKDVSDLVVSVRNTKFYVARMFLAAQSSFFKALLLGNFAESKKSEITLTGIDPADFHYLLEILYGEFAIDEFNVEGILLLADMYDAPTAVRRCESFILNESKKPLKKKLQMATRYNLGNLKEKCLGEIKTVTDLRSVLPADLNDLDPNVVVHLLKKSISFH